MKILITGATSGIGLNFVKHFYDKHEITVICRNKEKGLQLKNEYNIKILNVDLSDNNQITECFYKCDDNYDILINNAGMCATKKMVKFKDKTINKCLMVNLIAPYIFTEYMCKNKKVKKVITVNSITHWIGSYPKPTDTFQQVYANSKLSLMSLHTYWNMKYLDIKFVSINPGYVDTGIWYPNAPGERIHKHLRKIFALKPEDTIEVFHGALDYNGDDPIYFSVNKESKIFLYLTNKLSYSFMLVNDFLGKLLLKSDKAEINISSPNSQNSETIDKVVDFCTSIVD
jgi:short-subunit dehydrogenase